MAYYSKPDGGYVDCLSITWAAKVEVAYDLLRHHLSFATREASVNDDHRGIDSIRAVINEQLAQTPFECDLRNALLGVIERGLAEGEPYFVSADEPEPASA